MRVGIITVLYNSESVVNDFFSSLNTQIYKDFELFVINNASPDKAMEVSRKLAKNSFFKITFIDNDENVGVAKGNNQGIEGALANNCEFVLLSNNDIIIEPDTIEILVKEMEKNDKNLLVPKIYFHGTNQIWSVGGEFDIKRANTIHYGYLEEDKGQFESEMEVEYSPTCFMLIKSEMFRKIGMMDEKYFVYYDDTDFIYRANLVGEKILYIPQSIVYHKESTSTGGIKSDFSIFYYTRNRLFFIRKNYTGIKKVLALGYFTVNKIKEFLSVSTHKKKIIMKAIKEGLKLGV